MASRNAACLSQARWCVDAGHLVDCAQCVGARGGAVGKSLSLDLVNNCLQREYKILRVLERSTDGHRRRRGRPPLPGQHPRDPARPS